MTKTERTFAFNLFVFLLNALLFVVFEGGILLLMVFFVMPMFKDVMSSGILNALLPIAMLVGLFIAITLSVNIITWVIVHFHLEDKLNEKLVKRYLKDDKKNLKK